MKNQSEKRFVRTSVFIFAFSLLPCLLHSRFMTRRRLFLPHVRRVAIRTTACLLKLLELFLDRDEFWVGRFFVVLVTSCAGGDRNIRRQSAQSAGASNVDVAGRAFHHVLASAALVTEHR